MSAKKRLLSGVKPTGMLHAGNYFGAIRQFVEMQNEYETLVFIADYHSLTSERIQQSPEDLRQSIIETTASYIAFGLDPQKIILFKQSDIVKHLELTWIFNCLTTVPYLMRAHAFKDAQAKNKNLNVGTFDYPILMAADILMYDADIVPVGKDQQQHIEYARDIAEKFNNTYGNTFAVPEAAILADVATVPGIDGQKMSKSYDNAIGLFADDVEIRSAVMSIVTDSTPIGEPLDPETDNVFALHKLFSVSDLADIRKKYQNGTISYKESKAILVDNILNFVEPFRSVYRDLLQDPAQIITILAEGGMKAKEIAGSKMEVVRKKVGVTL